MGRKERLYWAIKLDSISDPLSLICCTGNCKESLATVIRIILAPLRQDRSSRRRYNAIFVICCPTVNSIFRAMSVYGRQLEMLISLMHRTQRSYNGLHTIRDRHETLLNRFHDEN